MLNFIFYFLKVETGLFFYPYDAIFIDARTHFRMSTKMECKKKKIKKLKKKKMTGVKTIRPVQ